MKIFYYLLLLLPLFISCSSDSDRIEDEGTSYFDENIIGPWDMYSPPKGEDYPYYYDAYNFLEDGTCSIDRVVLLEKGANSNEEVNYIRGTYQMFLPNHLIIKTDDGKRIRLQIELLEEGDLTIINDKGIRLNYIS